MNVVECSSMGGSTCRNISKAPIFFCTMSSSLSIGIMIFQHQTQVCTGRTCPHGDCSTNGGIAVRELRISIDPFATSST